MTGNDRKFRDRNATDDLPNRSQDRNAGVRPDRVESAQRGATPVGVWSIISESSAVFRVGKPKTGGVYVRCPHCQDRRDRQESDGVSLVVRRRRARVPVRRRARDLAVEEASEGRGNMIRRLRRWLGANVLPPNSRGHQPTIQANPTPPPTANDRLIVIEQRGWW